MGVRRFAVSLSLLLLSACSLSSAGTSTTPTPRASPTPTPTPLPDQDQVLVVQTGLGIYFLETVPVAVIHNQASRHAAIGVEVDFTLLDHSGRPLDTVTSDPADLLPGQTAVVAANCNSTCTAATTAGAVIKVADWQENSAIPVLSVTGPTYRRDNGSKAGQGFVSGALQGPPSGAQTHLVVAAACYVGSDIVGGGERYPVSWTPNSIAAGTPLEVGVIVSRQPTSCTLNALPGD